MKAPKASQATPMPDNDITILQPENWPVPKGY